MKHEEKINYMRIASGMAGMGFTNEQLDKLVCLYELVLVNKGNTNLGEVTILESNVKKRADIKHRSDMLDKVSKKV